MRVCLTRGGSAPFEALAPRRYIPNELGRRGAHHDEGRRSQRPILTRQLLDQVDTLHREVRELEQRLRSNPGDRSS